MIADFSVVSHELDSIVVGEDIGNGFYWNNITDSCGVIFCPGSTFSPVYYFRFDTFQDANKFARDITVEGLANRAKPRKSERFDDGYEVKAWGMTEENALKLAKRFAEDELAEAQYQEMTANFDEYLDGFVVEFDSDLGDYNF